MSVKKNSEIVRLQLPANKRMVTVDKTLKPILAKRSENYTMSVDYSSLLHCLSGQHRRY
mgnify:FL=1